MSLARRYGVDLLIVATALASAVEVALRHDPLRAPRTGPWFAVPAIALVVLVLLGRRRFPFAAPLTLWLLGAALSMIDGRLMVFTVSAFLAGVVAAALLGYLPDPMRSQLGLVVVLGGAVSIVYHAPQRSLGQMVFIPALFALAWLAGFALRERAGRAEAAEERARHAERDREVAARLAVAEERARIARELHDVVAHALCVMVLHVGAVRHKLPASLPTEADALVDVERTGRTALAELRRLVGAVRAADDPVLAPQPGLADLDVLLTQVRAAGLPVLLRVDGDTVPLSTGIDLSAYRIVQEGLTNALKHAHASQAEVTVRYTADELRIEVRDNGRGGSAGDGLGHGLVGVRERVKIFGGEMTAGAGPDRGFVLSTSLPLTEADR